MMIKAAEQKSILNYIVMLIIPILGLAGGVALSFALGINGKPVGNLLANIGFLLAVGSLIPIFKFSTEELGLKLKTSEMGFHIGATLTIFLGYVLFYIFVIRISSLKPIDSTVILSLITYLLVVFAEEIYFRGQVYSFIEKRFSARTALVVSAILFGLFHASQGLRGIITKSITGALWGSVRYTTGMIYLLIIPVHFAYNATWLLFEGNWDTPPGWAVFAVSIGELILTILILVIHRFRKSST
ncbi:MAG: type II CAAX endopeptidase family protein [Anaerolineales bacterium]